MALNNQFFFFHFTIEVNYTKGLEICEKLDMELISIPTQRVQTDIVNIAKLYPLENIWTSGSDDIELGVFLWRGSTLPNVAHVFSNWMVSKPTKLTTRSYIAVDKVSKQWTNFAANVMCSVVCVTDLDLFIIKKHRERYINLMRLAETINYQQ